MEFLIRFLANLFSSFKAKNPAIAAIVLVVLSVGVYTVQQGAAYGLFPVDGLLKEVLTYILLFLTAVTGSQTYQYENNK